MTWDRPEVWAAALSLLTAIFAAYATWRGPQKAAELAEELRRNSESHIERRRTKLAVFGAIMQDRADMVSLPAVQAFNLIDVAFRDAKDVRDAWADLHDAFSSKDIPIHVRTERLRRLMKAMAEDLALADGLRPDDFSRVYYPVALANEDMLRRAETNQRLAKLGTDVQPQANSAPAVAQLPASPFPPKP